MLPNIWIIDMYSLLLFLGVVACLFLLSIFAKKAQWSKSYTYTIEMVACASVIVGIGTATLFQMLFDFLKNDSENSPFAMTFFGGLVGGVITFVLLYFFYVKKKYKEYGLKDILIIAPACITLAHAFGRIGCFCAGCCYGIETNSWVGVQFPGMESKVYPTQLFEAFFLFVLTAILSLMAFRKKSIFTFPVYLFSYGVFRFLIEFIRGDDRGAYFLSLSPSQWFSIVSVILAVVLCIIFIKKAKQNQVGSSKIDYNEEK